MAFREAGLGEVGADPAAVAARVDVSIVKAAVVAALDDWSGCTTDDSRRSWLLDVGRRADPDASAWRNRVRDSTTWGDPTALAKLVGELRSLTSPRNCFWALGNGCAMPVRTRRRF